MSSLPLVVGVPREVKTDEHRVAITPDGVLEMTHRERARRDRVGGRFRLRHLRRRLPAAREPRSSPSADAVWERAGLVLKVKEPQPDEFRHLRARASCCSRTCISPRTRRSRERSSTRDTTAIGYETVQLADGQLPLLVPMSEVAGRMAPQLGAHFLERRQGGRGVLLGGAPGVRPARVVVLGAGTVGWSAAWIAQGMEAEVLMLDKNIDKLRWVDQIHRGPHRHARPAPTPRSPASLVDADLVIGAVLVPGGRAPVLVSEEIVASMRPGSVIVDCAIDQGGCVEGIRETTHTGPGVHRARRAPLRGRQRARRGAEHVHLRVDQRHTAVRGRARDTRGDRGGDADAALATGVNTAGGLVPNAAVAGALGIDVAPLDDALHRTSVTAWPREALADGR